MPSAVEGGMAEWESVPSDHQKKGLETLAPNLGVEFLHLPHSGRGSCGHSVGGLVSEILVFRCDETMVGV